MHVTLVNAMTRPPPSKCIPPKGFLIISSIDNHSSSDQHEPTVSTISPQENDIDAPSTSRSGMPIRYGLVSATTNLGSEAPTSSKCLAKRRVKILLSDATRISSCANPHYYRFTG
ncbi:hypothetical protein GUJ93_ZPchr0006g46380 [Zizania palustris]|uniref:Uncharacterized protein n=1 Tax=Zizania palustris TaxID=103762 RepID=A0A8J5SU95_ZIZPA|nr:hypothetical protein GUJ93_ZPchr0006g46380 [Zizania palustris]